MTNPAHPFESVINPRDFRLYAGDQQKKRAVFHSERRKSFLGLSAILRHRSQERATVRKESVGSETESGTCALSNSFRG